MKAPVYCLICVHTQILLSWHCDHLLSHSRGIKPLLDRPANVLKERRCHVTSSKKLAVVVECAPGGWLLLCEYLVCTCSAEVHLDCVWVGYVQITTYARLQKQTRSQRHQVDATRSLSEVGDHPVSRHGTGRTRGRRLEPR